MSSMSRPLDRFSAVTCTMLSELGAKSTLPLTLNTCIQRPSATFPSQRQVSESRPYCCCAPRTGATSRRARAPRSLLLFILSPGGEVGTAVKKDLAAESLRCHPRPSITDRDLYVAGVTSSSPRRRRQRHREIRRQLAAEGLDAELCTALLGNIEPNGARVRLEAVASRGLDRSGVNNVTAHGLGAHIL